jgi:hypothetical protein
MGLSIGFSRSSYDSTGPHQQYDIDNRMRLKNLKAKIIAQIEKDAILPNPNPKSWVIEEVYESDLGNNFALKIRYPDCTNYEGLKICVYHDKKLSKLITQNGGIDPHFSGHKTLISPFARFEPTEYGWIAAKALVDGLPK